MDPRTLTQPPSFPTPPRDVRFAAAFGRRALLAALGSVALLAALVIATWQLARGASLPFEDWALDGECATTSGEIVDLAPLAANEAAGVVRLTFRYRNGGRAYEERCHLPAAQPITGLQHTIEFLPRDPAVSRVLGTTRAVPAAIPWRVTFTLGGIGVLTLLLWLRFGVAQRRLLREGCLVAGKVLHARRVTGVSPAQVAIEYTYRDADSRQRNGRQWCPAKSALGRAVLAGDLDVHVVHDSARPEQCALASPELFEPAHGAS